MKLLEIQNNINKYGGDGWLFCDFHNRDKISYSVLNIDTNKLTTRRWYYFIPANSEPIKIVHIIEESRLDELPGQKICYSGWQELLNILQSVLANAQKIFMQYSPNNNIPTISTVDGGTIDLIRGFNKEILSSADLVQFFSSSIDEQGFESHKKTGLIIHDILKDIVKYVRNAINRNISISELDIQYEILSAFEKNHLTCDNINPMVAINDHAANPHFENSKSNNYKINENDRLLIDLWARENMKGSIYYDITWCFYIGNNPPIDYIKLFTIVRDSRKIGKKFIEDRLKQDEEVKGYEVDDICRQHIKANGYGKYFTHRTGHSIGTFVHGDGVNIDNLETKDDRQIIPGSCFSIEPGIYFSPIGVRSEINIYISQDKELFVVGPEQEKIVCI